MIFEVSDRERMLFLEGNDILDALNKIMQRKLFVKGEKIMSISDNWYTTELGEKFCLLASTEAYTEKWLKILNTEVIQ